MEAFFFVVVTSVGIFFFHFCFFFGMFDAKCLTIKKINKAAFHLFICAVMKNDLTKFCFPALKTQRAMVIAPRSKCPTKVPNVLNKLFW